MRYHLFLGLVAGCLLAADANEASKYTGPGSCSSPSCHGGVQARETSVLQNEYSTWVVRDKHAHAFVNLTNPVGTRIAKIMGLPQARHRAPVPGLPRARRSAGSARPHVRSHRRRGLRELPRAGLGVAGAAHHARLEVRQVAGAGHVQHARSHQAQREMPDLPSGHARKNPWITS